MEGLSLGCEEAVVESAEVERIVALVTKAMEGDIRKLAKSLVVKQDKDLLGPGEFELRDAMLRAASRVLEATINDRKKSAIKAAAHPAHSARKMRVSSTGESSGS
jgi:hypothetical protein